MERLLETLRPKPRDEPFGIDQVMRDLLDRTVAVDRVPAPLGPPQDT
jgi:hypothetical protein